MTLALAASKAVRKLNADNNIKLVKKTSFENGERAAVVYRDSEWSEYRILFFINHVHQAQADAHTEDATEAFSTAQQWVDKVWRDPMDEITESDQLLQDLGGVDRICKTYKIPRSRNQREGKYAGKIGGFYYRGHSHTHSMPIGRAARFARLPATTQR